MITLTNVISIVNKNNTIQHNTTQGVKRMENIYVIQKTEGKRYEKER
jgi:hypothetical protein